MAETMSPKLLTAIRAGATYFAIVLAIGFVLGTIRVMLIIPQVGELIAVCIEVPVLLSLSWWTCVMLVRRLGVSRAAAARLTMGIFAFALLMLAEPALSTLLFGRSPAQHWATYNGLAARVGLAAQLLFAALPFWQARITPPD